MRYLPLSATTVALLLVGTSGPALSEDMTETFSQYARQCILISDGSVRAYIPKLVRSGETGALATPCNPKTEVEVIFRAPGSGPSGGKGDTGPAGPEGPRGPAGSPS